MQSGIDRLFWMWKGLSSCRFSRLLFSYAIRWFNPYTGRLGAVIEVWKKGHAELSLKDRGANRNHLNSIHALALSNLGEFASGLALLSALEGKSRGIVISLCSEFIKKARGELRAVCRCAPPQVSEACEYEVMSEIYDAQDELVCRVRVTWKLESLV